MIVPQKYLTNFPFQDTSDGNGTVISESTLPIIAFDQGELKELLGKGGQIVSQVKIKYTILNSFSERPLFETIYLRPVHKISIVNLKFPT